MADPRHDWEPETRRSQQYKTAKLCKVGDLGWQPLGELAASQKPMVAGLERIADTPSERKPHLPPAQGTLKLLRDHISTVISWAQKAHVELIPREYDPTRDLPTPKTRRQPRVATADIAGAEDDDGDEGDKGSIKLIREGDYPSMDLALALGELWAERSPGRPWYRRLSVELAATSGLRWGEQHALTPRDILLHEGSPRIRVRRKLVVGSDGSIVGTSLPKMKKTRTALIAPHLASDLRRRAAEVETDQGPDGLLFPSPTDPTRPYTQDSFSSTVRNYAPKVGWPTDQHGRLLWTWHSLRHLACVWQLRDVGIDPAMVSEGMGHSSVTFTLKRYIGTTADSWDIAAQQMRDWSEQARNSRSTT